MNESARTITYVIVAVVAIGLALVLNPPKEITPETLKKANVGKEFYEDFKPSDATSIRVVAFDEVKANPRIFGVKFENGKWTIPTRYNYPADGADRLAKTATSVRHIKREELASSSAENQELFGVVDPLDKDSSKLKGRGQRITLYEKNKTLVDLIIGKQVKDRPGFFYIRKPDEPATYVAKISIDLSTKFSDWVETDLLKLDRNDLTEIVINNYKTEIDGDRLDVTPGENSILTHDKPADPWKLAGLEEGEELDTTKVNALVSTADDLKLAGIRPKPKGFRPDLTIDPEFVKRRDDVTQLALDLKDRGFVLAQDRQKQLRLYANEGELTAATNKGVVYTLKFGSVFLGDESDIELAKTGDKETAEDKPKDEKAADADAGDKTKAKGDEGKQPNRYLFVTASFDEKFLGPAPEKPTPPEEIAAAVEPEAKPAKKGSKKKAADDTPKAPANDNATEKATEKAEDKAADKTDDKPSKQEAPKDQSAKTDSTDENCFPVAVADDEAGEKKDGDEQPADKPAAKKDETDKDKPAKDDAEKKDAAKDDTDKKDADKKDAEKKDTDNKADDEKPQPAPQAAPKKSAEELKKEYDAQVKKYEADLKAHQEKIAAGKKQVDELNARFGAWYYVISAENFNKLHLSRKELVKEKGKPGDDKKTDSNLEPNDEEPDPVKDPLESLDEDAKKDGPGAAKKPE